MEVGQNRKITTLDILKEYHRTSLRLSLELVHDRCDLISWIDLLGNKQEILRLLALDEIKVTPEILVHTLCLSASERLFAEYSMARFYVNGLNLP